MYLREILRSSGWLEIVTNDECGVKMNTFLSCPTGRLPRQRRKKMIRANSEVKRSQEPPRKAARKAEAEKRIAQGAVPPVGAAGQRLVPHCVLPVFVHFLFEEKEICDKRSSVLNFTF